MEGLAHVAARLAAPFADPGSRTAWFALLSFVLVAAGVHVARTGRLAGLREAVFPRATWAHRSTRLDVQLLVARQLIALLGFATTWGGSYAVAAAVARALDGALGAPQAPVGLVVAVYPFALFVAWDLSRYVVHRLMHQVPALWAFHQVHHSAEVLTPLSFHRVHPVEGLIYGLRGTLVTGALTGVAFWLARGAAVDWTALLGVNGLGLALNVATGNLRHSHVWLRFPLWLERWLLSPAQHQLHHGLDTDHLNYGTWLAVWDRWGGSWAAAPATPPAALGLRERNHDDHLLSAWFAPFGALLRGLRPASSVAAASLVVASGAEAMEPEPEAEEAVSAELIVYSDARVPRVAGSAHVLTEDDLLLLRQDDIHAVLATVPGVYSRGEDGFGLRPNIGIRGAAAERSAKVTLMEDGVPSSPAPYAAPAAYYFPMVTRMVGVEVFKGPAAIQAGPQTVGGAINMLTRSVPTDGSVSTIDLAGGLRNTGRLHGFMGHGTGRSGVLGEVALLTTTGFKQLDGGGPTGFLRGEGMFKGFVSSDPARSVVHRVEVKIGYAGEQSSETYLGVAVGDLSTPYRRYAASALDLMQWNRTQAQVTHTVSARDWSVQTVAYHHDLERVWTKLNRFAGGPSLHELLITPDLAGQAAVYLDVLRGAEDSQIRAQQLMIGANDRRLSNVGVASTLRWDHKRGALESRLTAGVRVHADRVARLHTEDPHDMRGGELVRAEGPTEVLLDASTRADAVAAYVQEDLRYGKVSVLPGVRVEGVRTQVGDTGAPMEPAQTRVTGLPGTGVLLEAARGFQIFGGVYRGFSPVSPGSSEEQRPESAWNYEAGTRVGDPVGGYAEVVYFQNEYTNITGQCTLSAGCVDDDLDAQFNGGAVRMLGVEALVSHSVLLPGALRLPVRAAYTLTEGRFLTSFQSAFPQFGDVVAGDALPYVPRHQAAVTTGLEHRAFRLGVELSGRSGLLDEAAPPDQAPESPALWLLGAGAHVTVAPDWEVYLTGSNLTARTTTLSWRPYGARPVAPLQVMLGVRWAPTGA